MIKVQLTLYQDSCLVLQKKINGDQHAAFKSNKVAKDIKVLEDKPPLMRLLVSHEDYVGNTQ